MKTAIQELIRFIENDRMQSTYTKEQILELLNFKLEKEKEQIIESWDNGYANGYDLGKHDDQPNPDDAEQYYNETFKQQHDELRTKHD